MSLIPQTVVALSKFDLAGGKNIVSGAEFIVELRSGGSQAIFADAAGTIEIGQPAFTDGNGELKFYIEPGSYFYTLNGSTYSEDVGGGSGQIQVAVNDAVTYASASNANKLHVVYNGDSGKRIVFQPDSDAPLPLNGRWDFYNMGSGNFEIRAGLDVNITPPRGGSLFLEQHTAVSVIRIEPDEFIVIGRTLPE